jgi:hypothetical protein
MIAVTSASRSLCGIFFIDPLLTARWDFQLRPGPSQRRRCRFLVPVDLLWQLSYWLSHTLSGQAPHSKGDAVMLTTFSTAARFLLGNVEVLGRNKGSTTRIGAEKVENREDGSEDVEMPGPEAPANN